MGIWYLKSFIDRNKNVKQNVCVKVDLREIAQHWRESGRKAVIAADGHNVSRKFKHDYDFISGGEYKSIVENVKGFVNAFQEIGVDVVFFFGGGSDITAVVESKKYERRKDKRDVQETFREIEEKPILQHTSSKVPCLFGKVVKEATSSLCRFVRAPSDRDKSIVQYVIENECMGVFTDDTDLFVYEGVPHVFSMDALNVDDFTTIEYRRGPLLEALDLPGEAMPIFSTLMGNNIVIRQHTKDYHRRKCRARDRLSDEYVSYKVSTLAEEAKRIYKESRGDLKSAVIHLAKEIFETGKDRESQHDRLLQSLLTYKTSSEEPDAVVELTNQSDWKDILAYCKQLYGKQICGRNSFTVMDRLIFHQKLSLESSRLCSSEVLAELRRRTYSVLLFEKNGSRRETEFVEEVFTSGCRDPMTKYLVSTTPIGVKHPGLYRLWCEDRTLDDSRWTLILWMLSTSHCDLNEIIQDENDMFVFRQPFYQDHFGFVGLVLLYLRQVLHQLTENELTVLVVMTASVPVMNATDLQRRRVEYTTRRAVSISTIFQQTCYTIRWVLKVCNLKLKVQLCDLYSGLLFHYLFKQDDPTDLLDDLLPQARENYDALKTALHKCLRA